MYTCFTQKILAPYESTPWRYGCPLLRVPLYIIIDILFIFIIIAIRLITLKSMCGMRPLLLHGPLNEFNYH